MTTCTLIRNESSPELNKFVFSCIKVPWSPIKVKVCAYDTENSAKEFAEGEVEQMVSPPDNHLINYCVG